MYMSSGPLNDRSLCVLKSEPNHCEQRLLLHTGKVKAALPGNRRMLRCLAATAQ
jgi:hypothetical protein